MPEKNGKGEKVLTTAQFFCIIGTVYMTHDMDPTYRKWAGFVCFVFAIITEYMGH